MRKKFPALWVLQFLVLFTMGTISLCCPDVILQYSRGMVPPADPIRPRDELQDWALGLTSVPQPNSKVREFFSRMASDESQSEAEHLESGSDGFWTRNAVGASSGNSTGKNVAADWAAVKKWLLSCEPRLKDEESWKKVQVWILAADEFPDPHDKLLNWIKKQNGRAAVSEKLLTSSGKPEAEQPIAEIRHLILDSQPTQMISWRISADYVRQSAPSIFAAALFTLFGLLSGSIRRPLARIFVLVFLFWTVGIQWGRLGSDISPQHMFLFAGLIAGVTLLGTLLKKCPARASSWTI